jgi:hypothetical protein
MGLKEYKVVAAALKIEFNLQEVRGPNPDLVSAFEALLESVHRVSLLALVL